jgi:hypothetical protein
METKHIVELGEKYGTHMELRLSTVSTYAAGDGKWLGNLKLGIAGCTIRRAQLVMAWFSAAWPNDLEWPRHIPRPTKTKKEAA